MKIVITGTPGTGKTLLAKTLSLFFGFPAINDSFFVKKNFLGKFDKKSNEFEVPIPVFKKNFFEKYSSHLAWIAEGHLFCEFNAKADIVFVLRTPPLILEKRLEARLYPDEKIQDNLMCEGMDYCLKNAVKNYGSKKVFELDSSKPFNEVFYKLLSLIESLRVVA